MSMRNEDSLLLAACGAAALFVMVSTLALLALFVVQTNTHGRAASLMAQAKSYVMGQAQAAPAR